MLGFVNEMFKPGVLGSDLKKSLLIMFNNLKAKNIIPNFMKYANITTVPNVSVRIRHCRFVYESFLRA